MTPEFWAVIGIGVPALGLLINLHREVGTLHREMSALRERMAKLEGAMDGFLKGMEQAKP